MSEILNRLSSILSSRYEIQAEVGRGGMGVVFKATDRELKREVAIKVLPPELSHQEDLRKRFYREAQLSAGLSHPNIVPIYDVGSKEDLVWFVMQFVEGETLRSIVERTGAQSVTVVARTIREVAYALAYAHARGIVHRDIKPDNILLEISTGRAMVMDFGIAKVFAGARDTAITSAGMLLGSVAYMSPEQAAGEEELDGRSDLYSLGLVAHYMLTGRNTHTGPNPQAILAHVLTQKVEPVRAHRPDVPDWLETVITSATSASREERYDRAEDMIEQLDQGLKPVQVHPMARRLIRVVGIVGGAGVMASYVWAVLYLPPVYVPLVAAFLTTGAFYVYDAVGKVRKAGLGWKHVRLALSEERRHWFEERTLMFSPTKSPLPTWGKAVSIGLYGTIAVAAAVVFWFGRYRPVDESGWRFPVFMLLFYGGTASLFVFSRAFRLPTPMTLGGTKVKYIGGKREIVFPDHSEWRLPRWLDWLGAVLFYQFGAKEKLPSKTSVEPSLQQPDSAAPVLKLATLSGLTGEIKAEWQRTPEVHTRWPAGLETVERATALAGRVITTTHDLPPHVLTESGNYQQVLTELLNAVRGFDPADNKVKHEIDRLLSRVDEIARVIDAVLEVAAIVTKEI